ncbi:MAG: ABC transporter ATP-binding protein [Deltaproteobacteria bacterium]|nr:ABC transporter ATP-binding protein [Deltaproteobacteria bacterium]
MDSAVTGLRVAGLGKNFGKFRVLEKISFSTVPGEIMGLIGPNGAGKSTLLECLAGLLPADRGKVSWQGREFPAGRCRPFLWYQPDDALPFSGQRVGITLDFFRRVQGVPLARLQELVTELELVPMLDKPLRVLSKGFRRRVLLALGLLNPRPLLLLDEPFDGFDLRQSLAVMELLRRHRAGRTLLLSIHQLSEAEKICDRFLLLDQGRTAGFGSRAELARQAGLEADAGLEEIFLALV